MATHCSILAWRIRTEEPGRLHGVAKSQTQLSDSHSEGWDGLEGGRQVQEGGDMYIPMADLC